MTVPPIAPETQALLDAILPPNGATSSTHTDSLYALVEPLHAVINAVHARVVEIERLRRSADKSETDKMVFSLFENIKQTDRALLSLAEQAAHTIDQLTDTMWQLDRYGAEMKQSIDGREARLAMVRGPAVMLGSIAAALSAPADAPASGAQSGT